jgi:hypothetical protein
LAAQAEPFIGETGSDNGEESGEDGAPEPYTSKGKRGQYCRGKGARSKVGPS